MVRRSTHLFRIGCREPFATGIEAAFEANADCPSEIAGIEKDRVVALLLVPFPRKIKSPPRVRAMRPKARRLGIIDGTCIDVKCHV